MKHLFTTFISIRTRPWLAHSNEIIPLGKTLIDSSFPSGHLSAVLSFLTVIVYYYRKTWPLALVLILLMAFARMHNGMHYLSDVLAGAVIGFGCGLIAIYLIKKIRRA